MHNNTPQGSHHSHSPATESTRPPRIPRPLIDPVRLSQCVGQKYQPTHQQAAIIGAEPGSLLIVAGAGAGKTETMAARVVWLVANGYARPDQILGLTFTKKAAHQLEMRIKNRLGALADAHIDGVALIRENITPHVSTYDAYAGRIVREYGLLAGVEPTSEIIDETDLVMMTRAMLCHYSKELDGTKKIPTLSQAILDLLGDMDNHLVSSDELRSYVRLCDQEIEDVSAPYIDDKGKEKQQTISQKSDLYNLREANTKRLSYVDAIDSLREILADNHAATYGSHMAIAAHLAENYPAVREREQALFRVIMLDEYQDTSHSQRVLLRGLFGKECGKDSAHERETHIPLTVNAVGDPMQSIYGWRGATSANLEFFREDFAQEPPLTESEHSTVDASVPRLAPKKQLTISWRNPRSVLEVANIISDEELGTESTERLVAPLESRPGAPEGCVRAGWFVSAEQEAEYLARKLRRERDTAREHRQPFTAAVLVRKWKHVPPIVSALQRHGVPVMVCGVGGLVEIPEIRDIINILTLLVHPDSDSAALHLLAGPLLRIGLNDIRALRARARDLAREYAHEANGEDMPSDAYDATSEELGESARAARLLSVLNDVTYAQGNDALGLGDALMDLGSREKYGYSAEGYARLKTFAAYMNAVRSYAVGRSIDDVLVDIERTFRIRNEVLARENPYGEGASGLSHIDQFHTIVEHFSRRPGATIEALLEYLKLAKDEERGLKPGETRIVSDCVQILTVHGAKGLEWDVVCVPQAGSSTYRDEATHYSVFRGSWVTNASALPVDLRGDVADTYEESITARPRRIPPFTFGEVRTVKEANAVLKEHKEDLKQLERDEDSRLFYVAVTRAGRAVYITGSRRQEKEQEKLCAAEASEQKKKSPSEKPTQRFQEILSYLEDKHPEWIDYRWPDTEDIFTENEEEPAENRVVFSDTNDPDLKAVHAYGVQALAQGVREASFPVDPLGKRREATDAGVAAVLQAIAQREAEPRASIAPIDDTTTLWEQETTALIEEHRAAQRAVITVEMPTVLTASDIVNIQRDSEAFARRIRRPIPFKPSTYAKRGTAFHAWVEALFMPKQPLYGLLDDEALAECTEDNPQGAKLAHLKEIFLASAWAQRTPHAVEEAFIVTLGGVTLRGRMDAVFNIDLSGIDGGGEWMIVDWKTGHQPRDREEKKSVAMQLAVYRHAWVRKLLEDDPTRSEDDIARGVRAAFYYVAEDVTYEPDTLLSGKELAALIRSHE